MISYEHPSATPMAPNPSLADALRAGARNAPDQLREPLALVVRRLDDRWSAPAALLAMADELGSADADAIIASLVGGNAEIIRDGETGFLVPAADDRAMVAALDRLLADEGLRRRLGGAAASWVRGHASVEVMRDAYEAFYCVARNSRK